VDPIRLATQEEVTPIADVMDITPTSTVVTFGGKDFAVIRVCYEIDPMIFAEDTADRRKLFFLTNLETSLRLQGVKEVYFNVKADDPQYLEVLKHLGAEPMSDIPTVRFKKVL
jgi:hypothetical protein